jgi:hypothetical protein
MQMTLNGSILKAQGMTRAIENAESNSPGWTDRTIVALREFCDQLKSERIFSMAIEDFRATRYKDKPLSSNAWGSIPRIACRKGILRSTGSYRQANSPKTHRHPVMVYEII